MATTKPKPTKRPVFPLYDYEIDGELKAGEVLLVYEDGTRKRISLEKLIRKNEREDGESNRLRENRVERRQPVRTIGNRKTPTRQFASRKGIPLHKAQQQVPLLSR